MLKRLLLGICAGLGLTALVLAQTTPIFNLLGTETFVVTLGSGSSIPVQLNVVRNSAGVTTVATGTTVNSVPTLATSYLVAIGAITTWGVTLPNPANDGQLFCVTNGTGSTFSSNTSVTAATTPQSQTLAQSYSSQSLSAGASACWSYVGPTNTGIWYRNR